MTNYIQQVRAIQKIRAMMDGRIGYKKWSYASADELATELERWGELVTWYDTDGYDMKIALYRLIATVEEKYTEPSVVRDLIREAKYLFPDKPIEPAAWA